MKRERKQMEEVKGVKTLPGTGSLEQVHPEAGGLCPARTVASLPSLLNTRGGHADPAAVQPGRVPKRVTEWRHLSLTDGRLQRLPRVRPALRLASWPWGTEPGWVGRGRRLFQARGTLRDWAWDLGTRNRGCGSWRGSAHRGALVLSKTGRAMAAEPDPWNSTINGTWEGDELGYKCRFNEDFKYVLLPVSYGVVCVLGLCLNVVALYIFLCRLKTWNASTTYMFHLAVSDSLYAASLPLLVYYYAQGDHWPFSTMLCKLVRFLFYTNLYCSILFLTCISVHRCLGVLRPLHSLRWGRARYARRVAAVVWVLVLACQAPVLYFVTTSVRGTRITCHDTSARELFSHFVAYSSVMLSLLFAVPFSVILVCYVLMARRLLKPAYGTTGGLPRAKRKSVRTIALVLAVFALCFLPFHVTRTLYYSFRSLDLSCHTLNAINMAYKITRPLASANSCLDPVLYFLAGQRLVRFARDAKPPTEPTPNPQARRRLGLHRSHRTDTVRKDVSISSDDSRRTESTPAGNETKDIRL